MISYSFEIDQSYLSRKQVMLKQKSWFNAKEKDIIDGVVRLCSSRLTHSKEHNDQAIMTGVAD